MNAKAKLNLTQNKKEINLRKTISYYSICNILDKK